MGFVEQSGDLGNVFRRQAHFFPPKIAITWRSGLSSGGLTGAVASFADHTVSGRDCSSNTFPSWSSAHSMSCGLP